MEFRILGPLEVIADGRQLRLGGQKQRALLAMLLLDANRVVPVERLIDALWDDDPPETAAKAVQVHVSQLRKLLGKERLQTGPHGYSLRVEPGELDLDRVRRLAEERQFDEAIGHWRGVPLSDLASLRFAKEAAARIEELRLSCLEQRIERALDAGRQREVVGELEALVVEYPLRERLRSQLMLALYRSGRQAEALETYQHGRRVLVEELGIEPTAELQELHRAILRHERSLDPIPARVEATESSDVASGTFVGRERELAELHSGLEDAAAGRGRLFLLVGEPGIGKTRLADEVIRQARARGAAVLVGRCWEASSAPPYWPWVQSLRPYANEAAPELAGLLRGEPADADSDSARFQLFDATAGFLRSASRERPLLLFLDDMHAADEPSLLLLQFVTRALGGMHVLVIAACRDVDPIPGRALSTMLAEVAREPATTRLSLRGLNAQAVADYVEAELASRVLAPALYETTDGNPLFLGETVQLVAAEGRIAIPPSLRDVISRRLTHLSDECNRVLTLAAVLGREFDHAALAAMSGLSDNKLLELLDEAMTARIVSDVPGASGRSRFAHVLIRDALYDSLTPARRTSLHRAALEVLEDDAELAFHATAGDELDKARAYARRAGDRALALLAYEEAARLYDIALESRPDDATRCALLLARGEAETRGGDTARAKETFLTAAALAREVGLSHSLARAAAGYGGRIVWSRAGDDPRLVPMLEEGLAALNRDDVELEARLLARFAGALRDEYSRDQRDAMSARAVELARATGNANALAYALIGRAHAITAPDTIAEFRTLATEVCEVGAAIGDLERVEAGKMLGVMAESWLGDRAAADKDLAAADEIANILKQPVHLWEVAGIHTMLALAEGRFTEAATLANEALALGRTAIPEAAIPHYQMHRYCLAEFTGGLGDIEPAIAELAAANPTRPVFACAHAHLLALLGRDPGGLAALLTTLPFDQEWLYGMSLLAETATRIGDQTTAAAAYDALAPWAALHAIDQSEGCRGSVERSLGLTATTLGRLTDAAVHFERALAANERMGFRAWVAQTQTDHAHVLRLRGDDEQAAECEAAARSLYTELGATPIPAAKHASGVIRQR